MSHCTTFACSLIKVGALLGSIALTATAALAGSGPAQNLYVFPGIVDNNNNVGTVVNCFSFSPVQESLQLIFRDDTGTLVMNTSANINQFQTVTLVTRPTNVYGIGDQVLIATGPLVGVLGMTATSQNIVCTAHIVDAGATVPNGMELHGTRFNPISGTQE